MALIKLEEVTTSARIAVWNATEEIDFFKRQLPVGYLAGFNAAQFSENRKREFLASRFLLRKMLNDNNAALEINENGSISINGGPHISLSHSGEMVAAIVGKNISVGIDIEEIRDRVTKVMHKFINESERKLLGDNPELWKVTLCWSAKESIYKMIGQRGLSFSDDITLAIPETLSGQKFDAIVKKKGEENRQTVFFEAINGFILTWCFAPPQ